VYRLITTKGCGSTIVEAAFALSGLPYQIDEIDYAQPGPEQDRLKALNPLGQVPTLVLPGGPAISESAAMLLHIADVAPLAGLAPPIDAPERPHFFHWLMLINAAIYPTYTYGDDPVKWVGDEAAGKVLRERTDRHREMLWTHVENGISPAPWFLGERFSALDLYVGVMTRWRPRGGWFPANTPKLQAIADRVAALPALAEVWRRNFDES
jgi:GST-like protein